MHLQEIRQDLARSEPVRRFLEAACPRDADECEPLHVRAASGSFPAFLISLLFSESPGPHLCLTADADSAAYLASDLEQVHPELESILHLPPTGFKPFDTDQMHEASALISRADTLQQLLDDPGRIVVSSADAVFELLPTPEDVRKETLRLHVGGTWDPASLLARLIDQRFEHVEFIEQPGHVALRGGILDVYPFAGDFPIRIEFFGDEIDSIREIDIHSQRSISEISTARLVPNLERSDDTGHHVPLFDFLPDTTRILTFDESLIEQRVRELNEEAEHARAEHTADTTGPVPAVADLYLSTEHLQHTLRRHERILVGTFSGDASIRSVDLGATPQPAFNSTIKLLKAHLEKLRKREIRTIILCDSSSQEARLHDLLEDEIGRLPAALAVESLHEGFELAAARIALYTDHQIFDRYHRPSSRRRSRKRGGISLRELRNLNPGDFVVHVDYGIGRFAGLKTIRVEDRYREAVRLEYRDGDVLYVNINGLHKLHRYTGKEGHTPRLTKLGTGQWERVKARTKNRVKDIARDLIKIYARRQATPGHAFPQDTVWQREMEAAFQYEDTPDQAAATDAVKTDMQKPTPMDRLVCGDVGFGKTEVAVRAAFKAVQDGKQVAVLVPTTILAAQHYETFMGRLGRYPVRIESLSRFRSRDEQKAVAQGLERGEVDVVIGTHRMTSRDITFRRLGLVIIDEEQRFGVSAKEKLRVLRAEVDTLTLTATPIPRTLQFSLMGARDLSIIATAPPNRQPILTEIHAFDTHLIRDAIRYELSRQGQVFFIHNRVRSIEEISATLRSLLPGVRIRVAHGQMKARDLERVMAGFKARKFDVLVSTNIIENGLDIANANTIIIDRADRFGLAELHQMRGRVGRSNRKAFCYLLVPSLQGLTREARQRLQAVEEFTDLGSGFNLAMRDLDIRGAGAMLGAEQSGFIEDVGFDTYQKILQEAVQELRAQEFADVFRDAPPPATTDTALELDVDALIPDDYLEDNVERLNIYRRISDASNADALQIIREELRDRFGEPPEMVDNLLQAMALRNVGQSLRLPRVAFKNSRLFLTLPSQEADPYFHAQLFHPLLEAAAQLDHRYVIKESAAGKTRIIVQEVQSLAVALELAQRISAAVSSKVTAPGPHAAV